MSERRLLAVLALLMGLLGALLILLGFGLPRGNQDFLQWLGEIAVSGILALAAIVGSLLTYGGQYRVGGIVNLVIGVGLLILRESLAGSLLIVFSGILGLVAAASARPYPTR
ncbi:MAG TPA: hypothetical protein VJ400_08065 [Thermoplasmata archaeon]|nr:hypothetical protein [Thermoplasmata archaeon]